MRVLDLILAIVLLWAIIAVARREFPAYEGRTIAPPVVATPVPDTTP